ncbi:MAG TPA: dockerin type I domain-containing protein, partial [Clostridia bacterium]
MKKFILGRVLQTIYLLVVSMSIFTSCSFASGASNILGDADGNGAVNSTDFSLVKRYIVGMIKSFPYENGFTNADVTADGLVNSKDLAYIKRYLLGMIATFPGDKTTSDFIRPGVSLKVPTDPVPVNSDALFSINASDDSGIKTQILLLNGKEISLDSTANAVYKMESPGLYSVEAFVYDMAGNQGYARKDLLCVTDKDGKNPEALISSPAEGTVLTTSAAIKGTADDENFMAYTLEYSLKGKNTYIKFAEGKAPVKDGTLGVFDPGLVKKGIYDIRLTVYDNGGLLSKANITVVADGNSQGRLIQSSTDLSYMASGVPLDFTRWYDSGNVSSGDLGYGWSSYFGGIKITQSEDPSLSWIKDSEGSVHETKPHIVVVTYPDGKMDKFYMCFEEGAVPSSETGHLIVSFKAFPGTTSSLSCENTDCYAHNNPDFGLWNGIDLSSGRYVPGKFTLTASDGKKIEFGLDGSAQNITEKSGITTTLSDEGMTAVSQDTSVKVCYIKNAGVTESVYGLDGRYVTYAYDSYGDLVTVTGTDGKKTSYRYDSSHRIIDIIGSDGKHVPVSYPVQTASTRINNIAMVTDSIGMILSQGY